jgi:putative SOS response-associated peptidase YedK
MCTNYVPTRQDRLSAAFGVEFNRDDYVAEAWPGYLAPIIRANDSRRSADLAVFGLIPPWSRDGKNFRQCYNARVETVGEKPSFRHAWKQRHWCVIPTDAFFEPSYETGKPVRWRISSADDTPLAIAGIWDQWRAADGQSVVSFSMLTINADGHPVMSRFHAPSDEKRSIVLLTPAQITPWLSASHEEASSMLTLFAPERIATAPAPRAPGKSRSDAASQATKDLGPSSDLLTFD